MIELIYHKGKMVLPENFEELSGKQFIKIAPLLATSGEEVSHQVKALKILCGKSFAKWFFLKSHVINNALPFVQWVFEERHVTKQLIPNYRGYHGPASAFDNLRMKEFHLSEMFYKECVNTEGEDQVHALNKMVAVLYRLPKKDYDTKRDPDGDIRIIFNHNEVEYYAKKIAKWPTDVKQAIFIWYDGCRQELIDNNPMVFKEPSLNSFESQFDTGLYGVMRSLAGEKLGPIEKIEEMYVHTAMLEIGLIKEEEKFFEEKMKSNS